MVNSLTTTTPMFSPVTLGAINLRNRLVMAPLTRTRADDDGVPTDLMVDYYTQRASMGLIVTEGVFPVMEGRTWIGQPGLETDAQVAGWRTVTGSVHHAGGKIVAQIMHGGRIGHELLSGTGRIVAPSAIQAPGEIRTQQGKSPHSPPRALTSAEISEITSQFVNAARRAMDAGFDGVQLHGANGYLLHQFTAPTSNTRTDNYGGSPQNRARFTIEVAAAVSSAIGPDRVGIRLSPQHNIQGALENDEQDTLATYSSIAAGLAPLSLSHLDILNTTPDSPLVQMIRRTSDAPVIVNTGGARQTTRSDVAQILSAGLADAVSVGRAVLANPDLAERWKLNLGENLPDPSTFYRRDASGYTDYPHLSDATSSEPATRAYS